MKLTSTWPANLYSITPACRYSSMRYFIFQIPLGTVMQAAMLSVGEFAPISSAPKPCWTCVRRRVKCDLGLPTCFKCRRHDRECSGYGSNKPVIWTGVACRKKAKSRKPSVSCVHPTTTESPRGTDVACQILHSTAAVSSNPTDPVFQDLNISERRNVEYCESVLAAHGQKNILISKLTHS